MHPIVFIVHIFKEKNVHIKKKFGQVWSKKSLLPNFIERKYSLFTEMFQCIDSSSRKQKLNLSNGFCRVANIAEHLASTDFREMTFKLISNFLLVLTE